MLSFAVESEFTTHVNKKDTLLYLSDESQGKSRLALQYIKSVLLCILKTFAMYTCLLPP